MTTHAVWISGGKDSTALALRLVETQPDHPWRFVCTPTGNELPDMLEHWDRLAVLLGRPIERITHDAGLSGLIDTFQMLPSHHARWCTRMLKVEPAVAWYARNAPCIAYVGLRADEPERAGIFGTRVEQRYPLREWGWGISEVRGYLSRRGVKVPARSDCAWCYDQTLAEWFELLLRYPAIFEQGERLEAQTGHTFRSPSRDTWPVSLKDLRAKFQAGVIPPKVERTADLFDEPERCRMCTL